MNPERHSTVTDAQRLELWRRYRAGETILEIVRALDQRSSNLYRVLQAAGGIAPLPRTRSLRVLSFRERESARRPKPCLLASNRPLQRRVAVELKEGWSPQQIAGWLRDQYPGNPEMWVSHETI
jgi:IS30 family transposase